MSEMCRLIKYFIYLCKFCFIFVFFQIRFSFLGGDRHHHHRYLQLCVRYWTNIFPIIFSEIKYICKATDWNRATVLTPLRLEVDHRRVLGLQSPDSRRHHHLLSCRLAKHSRHLHFIFFILKWYHLLLFDYVSTLSLFVSSLLFITYNSLRCFTAVFEWFWPSLAKFVIHKSLNRGRIDYKHSS